MRELSQQFIFDADASEVYEFFMGPESERPRDIEITDGNFAFVCRFLTGSSNRGLYNITLDVYVCSGDKIDYLRPGVNWLAWDKEVADVALFQEKRGECRATLYIETDPLRWQPRDDGPWTVPMSVGTRFVISMWRELIQNWINRGSVGNDQVNENKEFPFDVLFKDTPAQFAQITNNLSNSLRQNSDYPNFPFLVMDPKMGLNDALPDDTKRVDAELIAPEDGLGLGFVRAQRLADKMSSLVATRYKGVDEARFTKWWGELISRLRRLNLIEESNHPKARGDNSELAKQIMPHINEIKIGINDLKRGQAAIYTKIDSTNKKSLDQIINLIQDGRIDQGEMNRTLDAIRRALRLIQNTDPEIDTEILKAKNAVESDLDLREKLELTLPIIPFFLQYKVELSAGSETDLNAVYQEALLRWKTLKNRIKKHK